MNEMKALVLAEHRDGRVLPATWEAIAAALQLAEAAEVAILVAGSNLGSVVDDLATAPVATIIVLDHPLLSTYTADGYTEALSQAIATLEPEYVVCTHTYQVRDYVPRLAARLQCPLATDVVGLGDVVGHRIFVRPMFQGRLLAEVDLEGPTPHFVSCQVGAFRLERTPASAHRADVQRLDVDLDQSHLRQTPDPPFQASKQTVDLASARRIVAVGRGIAGEEHLAIATALADALGAELAASRPVCDAGWLPIDRQVGSSGQTVAPDLYIALGISGAIQHLVGMRGTRTIVAVNKDAEAPIFEVAHYGIVGDLFDVVPELLRALKE